MEGSLEYKLVKRGGEGVEVIDEEGGKERLAVREGVFDPRGTRAGKTRGSNGVCKSGWLLTDLVEN